MEQTYEYTEDDAEEGVTLKKVGRFFAKGWVTMVLSIVAALLLATAIALPIKYFYKSEPVGTVRVEYVYSGVEKGETPDGGRLDATEIITPNVLGNAVAAAELESKITDISALHARMRVDSVESKERLELITAAANGDSSAKTKLLDPYYPTQFEVVISNPKKLGLSDSETKTLLDKVVTCYMDEFLSKYTTINPLNETFNLSDDTLSEFVDAYDSYYKTVKSASTYVKSLGNNSQSQEYKIKFARLDSDLDAFMLTLNQFSAYVVNNNIWRDKLSARSAVNENIARLTYLSANLKQNIEGLTNQLAAYKPTESVVTTPATGGQTNTEKYSDKYHELQEQLALKNDELYEIENDLKSYENRLAKIVGDDATADNLKSSADTRLKAIEAKATALMAEVNATVVEYYDTTFINGSVRRVQPPEVGYKTMQFSIVMVYLVAVIAGFIVGCIITGVLLGKSAKKAAKAQSEAKDGANAAVAEDSNVENAEADNTKEDKTGKNK
ncbi:MAG: hypothetical protein NC184_04435 [Roseburia sp.]|nr:hypothetical protein [Roseburia sp.]